MAKENDKQYDSAFALLLREGAKQPFWQGVKKVIQDNVDYLTDRVLNDESLSVLETGLTKRDFLRKCLQYNTELLDLPEKIANTIEVQGEVKPINFDPFKGKIGEPLQDGEKWEDSDYGKGRSLRH